MKVTSTLWVVLCCSSIECTLPQWFSMEFGVENSSETFSDATSSSGVPSVLTNISPQPSPFFPFLESLESEFLVSTNFHASQESSLGLAKPFPIPGPQSSIKKKRKSYPKIGTPPLPSFDDLQSNHSQFITWSIPEESMEEWSNSLNEGSNQTFNEIPPIQPIESLEEAKNYVEPLYMNNKEIDSVEPLKMNNEGIALCPTVSQRAEWPLLPVGRHFDSDDSVTESESEKEITNEHPEETDSNSMEIRNHEDSSLPSPAQPTLPSESTSGSLDQSLTDTASTASVDQSSTESDSIASEEVLEGEDLADDSIPTLAIILNDLRQYGKLKIAPHWLRSELFMDNLYEASGQFKHSKKAIASRKNCATLKTYLAQAKAFNGIIKFCLKSDYLKKKQKKLENRKRRIEEKIETILATMKNLKK